MSNVAQGLAPEQVHMEVRDDLTALLSTVHDELVPAIGNAGFPRDCLRGEHESPHERRISRGERVDRFDVSLRHDEHVRRRLRMDVVERDEVSVLPTERRRELTVCDAAEETGQKSYAS